MVFGSNIIKTCLLLIQSTKPNLGDNLVVVNVMIELYYQSTGIDMHTVSTL